MRLDLANDSWLAIERSHRLYGEPRLAAVSPGGTIRNMKVETFSPGLNGPGIWLLTGFKLWRKAAIARASSAVSVAKACQGMIGARMRPSGRSPTCIAFTICSGVQLPMPVFLSGVMFGPTKTP